MTALSDLKVYLATTLTSLPEGDVDTELTRLLGVEIADQQTRVATRFLVTDLGESWGLHPAPLREAILRRCARNLAMRKLPLGLAEGEAMTMRVSGRDGEVKRLEAPYARLVVG